MALKPTAAGTVGATTLVATRLAERDKLTGKLKNMNICRGC
jgi:hypothetical protein